MKITGISFLEEKTVFFLDLTDSAIPALETKEITSFSAGTSSDATSQKQVMATAAKLMAYLRSENVPSFNGCFQQFNSNRFEFSLSETGSAAWQTFLKITADLQALNLIDDATRHQFVNVLPVPSHRIKGFSIWDTTGVQAIWLPEDELDLTPTKAKKGSLKDVTFNPGCAYTMHERGRSPLQRLVRQNKLSEVVAFLTSSQCDVNKADLSGRTALHDAVDVGNKELILCLLDAGANVDVQDPYHNESPLQLATKKDDYELIKLLNSKSKMGFNSAIFVAALKNGSVAAVKLFIETQKIDVNAEVERQQLPLAIAAEEGHLELVKFLVTEAKANPNLSSSGRGGTAYDAALRAYHVNVARYLLPLTQLEVKHKGTVDKAFEEARAEDPTCPLGMAFANVLDVCSLHRAAGDENGLETLMYLLEEEKRVSIEKLNANGETPLHEAAEHHRVAQIRYLATKGANLEAREREYGDTPLLKAATIRRSFSLDKDKQPDPLPSVRCLIEEFKVDVKATNKAGETALHKAASREGGHPVVKYLVNAHPELINCVDARGRNALHKVMFLDKGDLETVNILIAAKCDIEAKDHHGHTPLLHAVHWGMPEPSGNSLAIIRCLVEQGKADVNAKDKKGNNVLHDLAAKNNDDMFDNLSILKYFATTTDVDIEAKDEKGATPIEIALEKNLAAARCLAVALANRERKKIGLEPFEIKTEALPTKSRGRSRRAFWNPIGGMEVMPLREISKTAAPNIPGSLMIMRQEREAGRSLAALILIKAWFKQTTHSPEEISAGHYEQACILLQLAKEEKRPTEKMMLCSKCSISVVKAIDSSYGSTKELDALTADLEAEVQKGSGEGLSSASFAEVENPTTTATIPSLII